MEQRQEFVRLAVQEGTNVRELCRRFGISPKTGYKLLQRYAQEGVTGLADRSRRPRTAPTQTLAPIAAVVCAVRRTHDRWGARKIHHYLRRLHVVGVPAPSTITAILTREGLLTADDAAVSSAFCRFEHAAPNDLWQMDFLGHKPLQHGERVHPLTVLDDHSRYLLTLVAAASEDRGIVQPALIACFRRYGLPRAILADNGGAWGRGGAPEWTRLEVWLLRLGVEVWHGRPYHPQTQGKVERIHRTINGEVFGTRVFPDLAQVQAACDRFRREYNDDRPHEALADTVPVEHYRISSRPYPETLPEIVYADDAQVRRVAPNGTISFAGYRIQVGKAFGQLPVGVIPTATDGQFRIMVCHRQLGTFRLQELDKEATWCYLCP